MSKQKKRSSAEMTKYYSPAGAIAFTLPGPCGALFSKRKITDYLAAEYSDTPRMTCESKNGLIQDTSSRVSTAQIYA